MADMTKYVVTCCQREVDGGRIDDNRPAGDVVINPDNSFRVRTAVLQCEECKPAAHRGRGLAVKLTTRNLGELLDADVDTGSRSTRENFPYWYRAES
jgi:hypothetical protein